MISKELIQFLTDLKANNNREWFTEHKPIFQTHQKEVKALFQTIEERLNQADTIEKHSLFRIYRDVRFSKDKTPYKPWFSGHFQRSSAERRGGYYLHIEPNKTIVGGGFYAPNPEDLKRIRQEFEYDDTEIRAILKDEEFIRLFGELQGGEVKSAPRGFDKNHPAIDLIKKKQFYAMRSFTDEEVLSPNFTDEVIVTFQGLRPYFDYMSSVLTTDLNGESIL